MGNLTESDPRLKYGCGDAGDLFVTGERLIISGGRLNDITQIRAGIGKLTEAGYPLQLAVNLARIFINDDRQSPQTFQPTKLSQLVTR